MAEEVVIDIDPHTHSEGSYDGKEPIELMIEHLQDIELDAIAITDHDNIEKSVEAAELAEDVEDAVVIPGIEISTKHGHLLGLGIEEEVEPGLSMEESVEKVRDLGGVAIVPHPFQKTRHGALKRRIKDCDAIEVFNAWLFTGFQNRRAKKFANKHDYPKIGASDAHSIGMMGRGYTELTIEGKDSLEEITKEDILEAIEHGGHKVAGKRAPLHKSSYHYLKAMTTKTIFYTDKIVGEGIMKINNLLDNFSYQIRKEENS